MTKAELTDKILRLVKALPEKKPLVHIIPNGVSAAFCADVTAASGARPVMADCARETAEITEHADAFTANLGQPSPEKEAALRASLISASEHHIPVVFDPVGVGASGYRKMLGNSLLSLPWKGIIKGNASEIHTLGSGELTHQGVDSPGFSLESLPRSFFSLPIFADRTLAVTGKRDFITDGCRTAILSHPDVHSYTVVGTGCAAGCLCGCFSALTEDSFLAAVSALSYLGYCQSKISRKDGYGTFKQKLLDLLSLPDIEELTIYLNSNLTFTDTLSAENKPE